MKVLFFALLLLSSPAIFAASQTETTQQKKADVHIDDISLKLGFTKMFQASRMNINRMLFSLNLEFSWPGWRNLAINLGVKNPFLEDEYYILGECTFKYYIMLDFLVLPYVLAGGGLGYNKPQKDSGYSMIVSMEFKGGAGFNFMVSERLLIFNEFNYAHNISAGNIEWTLGMGFKLE